MAFISQIKRNMPLIIGISWNIDVVVSRAATYPIVALYRNSLRTEPEPYQLPVFPPSEP